MNYGHIQSNLGNLLESNGFSKTKFCEIASMESRQLNKWINGEISYCDMYTLSKLCTILQCKIEDILVHIPPDKE